MTELEKCMAGMPYNCHDEIFLQFKGKSKELLSVYNGLSYEKKEEKKEILKSKRCGQCGCEGCSKELLGDTLSDIEACNHRYS